MIVQTQYHFPTETFANWNLALLRISPYVLDHSHFSIVLQIATVGWRSTPKVNWRLPWKNVATTCRSPTTLRTYVGRSGCAQYEFEVQTPWTSPALPEGRVSSFQYTEGSQGTEHVKLWTFENFLCILPLSIEAPTNSWTSNNRYATIPCIEIQQR